MTSPLEQKIRIAGPSVVTANRTHDGVVIWRMRGDWTTDLSKAAVVTDNDAARALLAEAVADDKGAVGAYIAPVAQTEGRVAPGNLREQIRMGGPTVTYAGVVR